MNPVLAAVLVGAGGAAGSVARYFVSLGAAPISARFPAGTLVVNGVGCLLAGVMLFFVTKMDAPSAPVRLLVATGFLGGLTTFSAFGSETVRLMQLGDYRRAAMNIAANLVLGLLAVLAGYAAARAVA